MVNIETLTQDSIADALGQPGILVNVHELPTPASV
jgi:hypothetical protein